MNSRKKSQNNIPKKPLGFLWFSAKPHMRWAFFAFSAVTVGSLLGSGSPYIFKKIVDTAIAATNAGTLDFSATWFWVVVYIVVMVVMYIAWRTSGLTGMQLVTKVQKTSYNLLFEHLSLHSYSYFSDRFAGAITNKISHASDGAERLIENLLWNYYFTIISFVVGGILIFTASMWVGIVYTTLIVVLLAVNYALVKYRRPYVVTYANETSTLRGQAVDVASNINSVRQFARRTYELGLLGDQVEKRRRADITQWRLSEYGLIINNVIIVVAMATMLTLMVALLRSSSITLGDFVMVVTLMFEMTGTLKYE